MHVGTFLNPSLIGLCEIWMDRGSVRAMVQLFLMILILPSSFKMMTLKTLDRMPSRDPMLSGLVRRISGYAVI